MDALASVHLATWPHARTHTHTHTHTHTYTQCLASWGISLQINCACLRMSGTAASINSYFKNRTRTLCYSVCMLFLLCEYGVCLWEEFPKSCKINQPWSQPNKNTRTRAHVHHSARWAICCISVAPFMQAHDEWSDWQTCPWTLAYVDIHCSLTTKAVIYTKLHTHTHTHIHTFGAADLYKPTPTWTVLELNAHSLVSGLTLRFLVTGRALRQHSWLLELLLCVFFILIHRLVRRHANIHTVCFNWYCEWRAVAFAISTAIAMQ